MTAYIRLVAMLNFVVNFLLLIAAQRFGGGQIRWSRSVCAACVGGVYGGICIMPGLSFMGSALWRCVSLCGVCWIAFGYGKRTVRLSAIFLLLSMAMGGLAIGIGLGENGRIIASAIIVVIVYLFVVQKNTGELYLPVELIHRGERICFTALKDTGNRLTDPITGNPVLVVGAEIAKQLTGFSQEQLKHPAETLLDAKQPGLRLVPFQSVGENNGLLLGMRISHVKIGGQPENVLVAFSPNHLSCENHFQALTGGS